jgi:hypothetical protein
MAGQREPPAFVGGLQDQEVPMSVGSKFSHELSSRLVGKEVVVALAGGDKVQIGGTLFAAQDDYVIVDVGIAPSGRTYIPTAAITYIRLRT